MSAWAAMLGGLLVWAAHFFALYGIASLFPGMAAARWLTVAATLAALAAAGALLVQALRRRRAAPDHDLERWMAGLAALGSGIALVAIAYQGLPALLA